MRDVSKLIESELQYFKPMLERSIRSSVAEREAWRNETIRQRQERISLEVFDMLHGTVRYGPFTGLKLDREAWWGCLDLGSQCLGLYELEILSFLAQVKFGQFATFIDIGAADGYYAIGMLKTQKIRKAICFEQSELGRETIAKNWRRNDSKGILEIFAEANPETICALPRADLSGALVMVDIEGAEFDVLVEKTLSVLKSCTIVIEIHNWIDDFSTRYSAFLQEASKYFEIEIFKPIERPTSSIKELADFTDDNRLLLVSERRPCLMRFIKLVPRPP
ncbi:MAG: hypothetical protein O9313_02925 [Acetobacteraceae bacterium]|jgi:hypothetical protein|nr:hypothetical protein [Acetobacteraceae bacterium]